MVSCCQMSTADFEALAYKDPFTIYFVNETGVFTAQSLDEEGDIYLGEKLLTSGERLIRTHSAIWVSATEATAEERFEYDISTLNNASCIEISADLVLANEGSSKKEVVFYIELCRVEGSDYTVDTALAQTIIYIPSARNNETTTGNAHLSAMVTGNRSGLFAIRIGWYSDGQLTPIHYHVSPNDPNKLAPVSKFEIRAWARKSN